MMRILWALGAILSLVGCYNPPNFEGVPCSPEGQCLPGQTCNPDGLCFSEGEGPDASAGDAQSDGDESPVCNPRLAFSARDGDDPAIFIANSDGSDSFRFSPGRGEAPAWSPDGKHIAYVTRLGSEQVVAIQALTNQNPKLLPADTQAQSLPIWSPDSKKILYKRGGFVDVPSVAIVDLDSEVATVIDGGGANLYEYATFFRDGSRLLLAQRAPSDLVSFALDGSDEVNVTNQQGDDAYRFPGFSPDGESLVVSNGNDVINGTDIFVLNRDGTGRKNLTNSPGDELAATWSPDGTAIAFDSDRTGSKTIFVMNSDGTGLRQLSEGVGQLPVWSPDGDLVVFYRFVDSRTELVVVDSNSRDEVLISPSVVSSLGGAAWEPCR